MKSKILILAAVVLLVVSCGTQKSAAVATTETTAAPVTETTKSTALTPELAEAKNLYENSCGRCHKLYEANKFTQEEWKPILARMQKKAKLDDTQMVSISNYINSQL
ncbi:cytochrome C [Flavobacterium sp. Leaf82]|uniref:cytochrome c n=1 Tax=unclassified Flavobacterium TaxID=196869 RepID=UPI00070105FF|nr:cytochrome c [Flavobacterium sp. Leaf82]KQO32643.1 cytochrome C [Flavobacterium sp. Leaf82]